MNSILAFFAAGPYMATVWMYVALILALLVWWLWKPAKQWMDQALIRKDQDIELDKKITSIDGKFDELLKELHDREKDKCTTHHLKILEETTKLITRLENMEETFEEMSDILAVLSDKAKGYDPKRNELMNRDIIIIRKQVQILVDRMESMKTGGGTEEAKQALKSLSKLLGVDTGRSRLDNFEEE